MKTFVQSIYNKQTTNGLKHNTLDRTSVFTTAANRSIAVQGKGHSLHPVQLQEGWPEDDTDCPLLSTPATRQTPHSEFGIERRMMAAMTSQDACNP